MRLLVSKVMLQACFETLSVSEVLRRPWTKKTQTTNVLTWSGTWGSNMVLRRGSARAPQTCPRLVQKALKAVMKQDH